MANGLATIYIIVAATRVAIYYGVPTTSWVENLLFGGAVVVTASSPDANAITATYLDGFATTYIFVGNIYTLLHTLPSLV